MSDLFASVFDWITSTSTFGAFHCFSDITRIIVVTPHRRIRHWHWHWQATLQRKWEFFFKPTSTVVSVQ